MNYLDFFLVKQWMDKIILGTQLFTGLFMVGLIWVVQIVIYPMFADVPESAFPNYEQRHAQSITWIVMPVMLLELITLGLLVMNGYPGVPSWIWWASAGLLAITWGITFLISVPCHGVLTGGFDAEVHRRLVSTNWIRTFAWTVKGGLILWGVLGS